MTFQKIAKIRENCSIPHYIELLVLEAHERAWLPKLGCVAISEYLIKAGMLLPLYHFLRTILRSFMLAPAQVL